VVLIGQGDERSQSQFLDLLRSSSCASRGESGGVQGILSRVEPSRALSLVVPLLSDTDFNLHDYDRAEPLMLQRLADSVCPLRSLQDSTRCPRAAEFLATVAELMEDVLAGQAAPLSRCYVYDAQENTLALESYAD